MKRAVAHAQVPDPTIYPEEDDVGENILHHLLVEELRPLIAAWLRDRGVYALAGANTFIYWEQHNPTKSVSPDVYVMPGVAPDTIVGAWKLWEAGAPPSLAIEIVSRDVGKDYVTSPRHYAELGVKELVIFDPESSEGPGRVRWQVLRQVPRRGFVVVRSADDDRVRSQVLGCWLRAVGAGSELRLRLATGPRGESLVPTDLERALERVRDAERAEQAARQAEQAARQAERSARLEAEARVAALEAELARLRGA